MTAPRSTRRPAPLPDERLRGSLRERFWLRLHVAVIALLTGGATWAVSALLLRLGLESMPWRYAIALALGYAVYLALLRLWARQLLRRESPLDQAGEGANLLPQELPLPRGLGSADPAWRSGGGGDFGGGGASGDFGPLAEGSVAPTETAPAAASLLDAAGAADEAAVVVLPVTVVLAAAALLAGGLGLVVGALFGVEVLLAVAVEIAFASAAGSLALRARREGWLLQALRRTAGPMTGLLLAAVLAGALLQHVAPAAVSLPGALHGWLGG